MRKVFIIIVAIFLTVPAPTGAVDADVFIESGVVMTEVKLGGGESPKEFVELFNSSNDPVELSDFVLEYAKPAFPSSLCHESSWKAAALPASLVNEKPLTGTIEPYAFLVIEMGLNDDVAGAVRLASSQSGDAIIHDLVGWGDEAPCFQTVPVPQPGAGQALKRIFGPDGYPIINSGTAESLDFTLTDEPSPGTDPCLVTDCHETDPAQPVVMPDGTVQITELLPDPVPPLQDSHDEYIELYNVSDQTVDLSGYVLYAASESSTRQYVLQNVWLSPGEYRTFYSKDTGLSLVNGKPGHAKLLRPDDSVLSETDWYPPTLGAGSAWALLDSKWQITDVATPGAANKAPSANNKDAVSAADTLKPCPAGKYRNPQTNRCRSIISASNLLTPCAPGQERNPATNRCRRILAATAARTACKPGQERNPATNRCRAIKSSQSSSLRPCQEGYERNPATNRCRKSTGVAGASSSREHSEQSDNPANLLNKKLIIAGSVLLGGYAVYEYRHDIVTSYQRFRGRLRRPAK